ncbi:unnamed protein product [Somion occarium]|uniref:Insulin-degrading enzyme n=1 Tax=Somion occarium TaxID=3059160 RepID=A0ABP1DCW8_9APHY
MQRLLASRPISFSPILRRPFTRNRLKPPPRLFLRTMATPSQDIQWQHVQTKGPTPSYNVFPKPVRKSENDDREYRIIRLENGLEAMVIQDATADKAAASLDVAVGHLHDPDDMPGLAHFCEHLLFMGTEIYPKENEYSEYLAKNNGYSNAFTGTTNTNYFFTVSTGALSGALSRFAAFFHCPLFDPSCTTRELNAVDSEHKKNHQNDIWRIYQINKHLSKEGHPWRKFGSGNKDSLTKVGRELKAKGLLNGTSRSATGSLAATPSASRVPSPAPSAGESEDDGGVVGRETRRRLVEWWSKEYDANRMRLCVIGKEPVEELSDLVSKLFSPIPNSNLDPLPMIPEHPFGPNETGTLVSVQTIMGFHALEVSFPLPYQPPFWRHQPGNFLAHFIGHEGPGSLHSYLKHKGWVSALSAGPQPLARGIAMFKVTLRLTKEGFENHREITLAVYKYLSLLHSSEFPAWYQREIRTIRSMQFQFAEKRRPEDYALWVAEHMSWPVPRDAIISAPRVVEDWDSKNPLGPGGGEREVRETLEGLNVEKGRTVLMAKKEEHERIAGVKDWQTEPWYGTGFAVERYDEEFVKQAQSPNDIAELFLPGPNEFIPENLKIEKREIETPEKRPHLIRKTPLSELWHKKDDQWWVPKAQVIIDIRTPVANESPRASAMTRLFAELVTDSLTEYSYDADLAGLTYSFASHNLGVFVSLNGYNDKLHVLAKDIFEKARTLIVNPERLETKKQELKRDWENFFFEQSFRLSDYFARYVLTEKHWLLQEKLDEISTITAEEVQAHIARLLSEVQIRALIVGNMYKDAIRLMEQSEEILQASPISSDQLYETALFPPQGSNLILSTPASNPNEPNSALTYFIYAGSLLDRRLRVISSLVIQLLTEPAFNILRTREQLGYIVSCSPWTLSGDGVRGIRIVVQSERSPAYLEQRVDAFLDEMKETIEKMPEDEWEAQKEGLKHKWVEKHKNMSEETNSYWPHIDSGYLDFLRRDENVEILPSVTREEVLSFFNTYVHPASSSRGKLSVHVKSRKPRPAKISLPAIDAISELVASNGVTLDPQFKENLTTDGEPSVEQLTAALKDAFVSAQVSPEQSQQIASHVSAICEKFPADSADEGQLPENAKVIEDPKVVKAELKRSGPPKPVTDWGDLPISRF